MRDLITTREKFETLAQTIKETPSLDFLVLVGEGGPVDSPLATYGFEELCALQMPPGWRDHSIEKDLADEVVIEQRPRLEGRQMIMMVAPKRKQP